MHLHVRRLGRLCMRMRAWSVCLVPPKAPPAASSPPMRSAPCALPLPNLHSCASLAVDPAWLEMDNVDRRSNLSPAEFREQYEVPNRPVILTDVVGAERAVPCRYCWAVEERRAFSGLLRSSVAPRAEAAAGPGPAAAGLLLPLCRSSLEWPGPVLPARRSRGGLL